MLTHLFTCLLSVIPSLLFIWDDLEKVISNKDCQSEQENFHPNNGREGNGNSHQDIDGHDNFFLTLFGNRASLPKICDIDLIHFGVIKPILNPLGAA